MTVFFGTLRRIFKQPLNWAFLMLFPVLSFILLSISSDSVSRTDAINMAMYFGVADNDNTAISKTLANQLALRYNIVEVDEADIPSKLTDQSVPWILLIREGFERDVLAGNTEFTTLEGYSLTISDISALGSATAENITRALMVLGSNDAETLSAWEEAARVEVEAEAADAGDHWEAIAQWLSMFGYISMFTAYFVVKTLLDDKKHGMPDRVGILPVSPRNYLIQGSLAAFAATEITVALTLGSMWFSIGSFPNVPLMFLLLSLYNLFSVSFVLSITSVAKSVGGVSVALTMIATLSAMLGGLFWPLEVVPDIMKRIAWFTPGYWLNQGIRNVREPSAEGFAVPLLFLLGFTVVTMLIGGFKKVRKMEE